MKTKKNKIENKKKLSFLQRLALIVSTLGRYTSQNIMDGQNPRFR